jgi:hypothetical protein
VPPPRPRLCPAKIHLPWLASLVLSKRLANTLSSANPAPMVSSYQVAHGTVRPAPAKSIDGASPSRSGRSSASPRRRGSRSSAHRRCPIRASSTRPARTSARTPVLGPARFPPGGRSPTARRRCRGQGAADNVGVGRVLAVDAQRPVDADSKVIVDLAPRRQWHKGKGRRIGHHNVGLQAADRPQEAGDPRSSRRASIVSAVSASLSGR